MTPRHLDSSQAFGFERAPEFEPGHNVAGTLSQDREEAPRNFRTRISCATKIHRNKFLTVPDRSGLQNISAVSCGSLGLSCIGCSLALLRLRLSTLVGSSICSLGSLALGSLLGGSSTGLGSLALRALLGRSSIRSLSPLSLSSLLSRSSRSLCGLALAALLRCGGSSFGGLGLPSLLRGSGGGGASLGSLGLTTLLSSSVAALISSGTTASCDTSDINARSVEGVDVVLVARVHNSLNSLLKVCARVGRTSCWIDNQQLCLTGR